jgi:Uma2 family endonuclease
MENEIKEPAIAYNFKQYTSPEDYLKYERLAGEKHEYYNGTIVKMQGAGLPHNHIVANVVGEVRSKLKGKACNILPSDMRTVSPGKKSYTYPDAVIICGKPEMEDDQFDTLKNPTVIIEVLSKSTENYNRRRKMIFYIQIPSLQEYVMINSIDGYEVTVCRRAENEAWTFQLYTLLEENVELKSVGISINMAELYENVTFETKEEI